MEEFISFSKNKNHFSILDDAFRLIKKKKFVVVKENDNFSELPEKGIIYWKNQALLAFKKGDMNSSVVFVAKCNSPELFISNLSMELEKTSKISVFSKLGQVNFAKWMNRDLKLVGNVVLQGEENIFHRFDSVKPVCIIQNQHKPNDKEYEVIFSISERQTLRNFIAKSMSIEPERIVTATLFFVDIEETQSYGPNSEFITGNMQAATSCYTAMKAFLECSSNDSMSFLVIMSDQWNMNGSQTNNIFTTFINNLLPNPNDSIPFLSRSILMCVQGFDALNPNMNTDTSLMPRIGGGVVVGSTYSNCLNPDSFKAIDRANKVGLNLQLVNIDPLQISFGSPFSLIGIPCIDIGFPVLSMNSFKEMVCWRDIQDGIRLFKELYQNV